MTDFIKLNIPTNKVGDAFRTLLQIASQDATNVNNTLTMLSAFEWPSGDLDKDTEEAILENLEAVRHRLVDIDRYVGELQDAVFLISPRYVQAETIHDNVPDNVTMTTQGYDVERGEDNIVYLDSDLLEELEVVSPPELPKISQDVSEGPKTTSTPRLLLG